MGYVYGHPWLSPYTMTMPMATPLPEVWRMAMLWQLIYMPNNSTINMSGKAYSMGMTML